MVIPRALVSPRASLRRHGAVPRIQGLYLCTPCSVSGWNVLESDPGAILAEHVYSYNTGDHSFSTSYSLGPGFFIKMNPDHHLLNDQQILTLRKIAGLAPPHGELSPFLTGQELCPMFGAS